MEFPENHLTMIAAGVSATNIVMSALYHMDTIIDVVEVSMAMGRRLGAAAYEIRHPNRLGKMIYYVDK